ncbi:MAG TPA: phosphatase PAP2 family protein [Jatrophihabitans sp.]|nr:phosphatase PAP2 family protein [Jatrophihabitans sp.]
MTGQAVPAGRLRAADAGSRRQVARQAGRLLVGAVLILAMLVALGQLLTHQLRSSGLTRWDGSVDRWFVHRRTPGWNAVTKVATFGAETVTVAGLGLLFVVLLRWQLGRWRESVFLAASVIGEVSIFVCTTLLVERHRPAVPRLDSAPPTSSFPSGHTAASVALYGGLAVIAWHAARAAWLRTVATALAVLMPVAVGLSRLYRGMHNPTDVLAGALLSVCWLTVTSLVLLATGRTTERGVAR